MLLQSRGAIDGTEKQIATAVVSVWKMQKEKWFSPLLRVKDIGEPDRNSARRRLASRNHGMNRAESADTLQNM